MPPNYDIAPLLALRAELLRQLADDSLDDVIAAAGRENPWFTPPEVRRAVGAICNDLLAPEVLSEWLARYPGPISGAPRAVGIVMAGNLPLVGFADLLCVLLAGHRALVKPSSKDRVLTEYLIGLLRRIEPRFCIGAFDAGPIDALVAMGGDSACRALGLSYAAIPTLLRGHRYSVAILDGSESEAELAALSEDVFAYFGLGCRSVSQVFVPQGYDLLTLHRALSRHSVEHSGLRNSCRQAHALLTMTGRAHIDGGYYLLCEDELTSPALGVIRCIRYESADEVAAQLAAEADSLQCVVARSGAWPRRVNFGEAQHPRPWDYPDGKDTMQFLLNL